MKRLLFVGIFICSIFTNLSSFNSLGSGKQDYLNKKIEGLSARLDELLSDYKNDGDKDRVLGEIENTRNNILNNVSNENEKKALQKLDKHFDIQGNFIPVNLETQKTSASDKIYNITLKLLSPTAIVAFTAVIITRSIERMVESGSALELLREYLSIVRWQFATYIAPYVMYFLPAIGTKLFALVG